MNSESIYLMDIIRQFGADGLKRLLEYFYNQRKEAGDMLEAQLCLEDIILNTQLLTYNEYDYAYGGTTGDVYIVLDNKTYVLVENLYPSKEEEEQ